MKIASLFVGTCLSLFAVGCGIDNPYVSPPQREIVQQTPSQPITVAAPSSIFIENEISTSLRVGIFAQDEKEFCDKLAALLAESADRNNVKFVSTGPWDVNIILKPEFEIIDMDNEYCRIDCKQLNCSIQLIISGNKKEVCAIKTFIPEKMPRQLGKTRAKDQYLMPLSKQIVPFVNKELANINRNKIAVSDIAFKLQNIQTDFALINISSRINKINGVLKHSPGIVNYQIVSQDEKNARCTFRIAYLKDAFPQGLTNYLNQQLKKHNK